MVTFLMAKHADLSSGIIYSVCFFKFKLLSVCRPRNLSASASSINCLVLSSKLYVVCFIKIYYQFEKLGEIGARLGHPPCKSLICSSAGKGFNGSSVESN
jgi:hypothetical protein